MIYKSEIDSKIDMNAKILPFKKSPNIYCNFGNITLSCYQPNTCYNIPFNIDADPCIKERSKNEKMYSNTTIPYKVPFENNKIINEINENENSSIFGISINGIDILTIKGIENMLLDDEINNSSIDKNNNENQSFDILSNENENKKGNENENKKENENENKKENENENKKGNEKKYIKSKSKNQKVPKNEKDDIFIYIVFIILGISTVVIIILIIVCLITYRKTGKKNENLNNHNIDADIIISEKYTL
eukprot:jgi/Orpsp1_1/1184557/evm.model.c7180000090021.1